MRRMNPRKPFIFLLTIVLAVYSLSAMAKKQEWPEVTEDGLHRVHDSSMSIVYAEPGADLSIYSKVIILEPTVAFDKNWERDQRHGSASKLSTSSRVNTKKIKKDLAAEFMEVFTATLIAGGYEVVSEAGDDVLLLRPAIVNLDITAPQTHGGGRSASYVRSAGEMTLAIDLFDSVTGDVIAKALDRKIDNENDARFATYANASTNKAAAKRILVEWAEILLGALNDARSHPAAALPDSD